jgi:L-2-hydroxyglutarate oxidase LhgO
MENLDITIIGAGVIGLAIASKVANERTAVAVLERHPRFGLETSSRNSEVIHAGLYYPPESLKAKLCVAGNRLLYDYCRARSVRCARIGKLVVATEDSETARLERLWQTGKQNGAPGLEWWDRQRVKEAEPRIVCAAGLYSPTTGIVDTHGFMQALAKEAEENGALLVYDAEVIALEKAVAGFTLTLHKNADRLHSRIVINCAGLAADRVAALAGIDPIAAGYRLYYSKGDYFRTSKPLGVQRLIYPVPELHQTHLGIHLTKDLAGGVRFGPDAEYVDALDYSVAPEKRFAFCESIQKYLPTIGPDDLYPDTSGVRPKLQGPEDGFRDFVIRHEAERGLEGLINLCGIESPGLTAALAIAEHVQALVAGI